MLAQNGVESLLARQSPARGERLPVRRLGVRPPLLRLLEQLLAEERHLLVPMSLVESYELGERPRGLPPERGEVRLQIGFELVQHDLKLRLFELGCVLDG